MVFWWNLLLWWVLKHMQELDRQTEVGTPRCEGERGSGCRQTIALQIGQGERKGTGRGEARMRWLHNSIPRKSEAILPS